MSTIKHLKKCADILWNHFDDEIREEKDWYWNLKNWTINFTLYDDSETIVAYKCKDDKTDWSTYIVLSKRIREWRTIDA